MSRRSRVSPNNLFAGISALFSNFVQFAVDFSHRSHYRIDLVFVFCLGKGFKINTEPACVLRQLWFKGVLGYNSKDTCSSIKGLS